jgi:hypothetical protein
MSSIFIFILVLLEVANPGLNPGILVERRLSSHYKMIQVLASMNAYLPLLAQVFSAVQLVAFDNGKLSDLRVPKLYFRKSESLHHAQVTPHLTLALVRISQNIRQHLVELYHENPCRTLPEPELAERHT